MKFIFQGETARAFLASYPYISKHVMHLIGGRIIYYDTVSGYAFVAQEYLRQIKPTKMMYNSHVIIFKAVLLISCCIHLSLE